jgi:hypothetical protein
MGELIGFPPAHCSIEDGKTDEPSGEHEPIKMPPGRGYKTDGQRYGIKLNSIPTIIALGEGDAVVEYMEVFDSLEDAIVCQDHIMDIINTLIKVSAKIPMRYIDSRNMDGGVKQKETVKYLLDFTWGKEK